MESLSRVCYSMRYETSRNRPATGAATPAGHSAATGGQESVGGGTRRERLREFGVPMVRDVPTNRAHGVAAATDSGPAAQALPVTEKAPGHGAPEGPPGGWLSDGSVDLKPRGPDDPKAVRRGLSSLPRLETPGQPRMELSETGASSPATGRRGDCP